MTVAPWVFELPVVKEYRANKGVILSAKRLFLQLMEFQRPWRADPNLRDRLKRRIINNNETILQIDCTLSPEPSL